VKVLFINGLSAKQGGGKTYVLQLLQSIPDDAKVYLLVQQADDNYFCKRCDKDVKIISFAFPSKSVVHRVLWEKIKLPFLLETLGINYYFAPGGVCNINAPRIKTVITFQNMLPFSEIERKRYPFGYIRWRLKFLKKLFLNSFNRANKLIFIFEYAKRVIEEHFPDIGFLDKSSFLRL
jgi:hypothetical protein